VNIGTCDTPQGRRRRPVAPQLRVVLFTRVAIRERAVCRVDLRRPDGVTLRAVGGHLPSLHSASCCMVAVTGAATSAAEPAAFVHPLAPATGVFSGAFQHGGIEGLLRAQKHGIARSRGGSCSPRQPGADAALHCSTAGAHSPQTRRGMRKPEASTERCAPAAHLAVVGVILLLQAPVGALDDGLRGASRHLRHHAGFSCCCSDVIVRLCAPIQTLPAHHATLDHRRQFQRGQSKSPAASRSGRPCGSAACRSAAGQRQQYAGGDARPPAARTKRGQERPEGILRVVGKIQAG